MTIKMRPLSNRAFVALGCSIVLAFLAVGAWIDRDLIARDLAADDTPPPAIDATTLARVRAVRMAYEQGLADGVASAASGAQGAEFAQACMAWLHKPHGLLANGAALCFNGGRP